jgi:large subunit ribosomal protein L18
VHRTPRHIYAQIIDRANGKVLVSASTLEAGVRQEIKNGGNVAAAMLIGKLIAEKAKKAGITRVAFDRSGFKYHGRIRALAEAARENGLNI